jgi:hypothetical protein
LFSNCDCSEEEIKSGNSFDKLFTNLFGLGRSGIPSDCATTARENNINKKEKYFFNIRVDLIIYQNLHRL